MATDTNESLFTADIQTVLHPYKAIAHIFTQGHSVKKLVQGLPQKIQLFLSQKDLEWTCILSVESLHFILSDFIFQWIIWSRVKLEQQQNRL